MIISFILFVIGAAISTAIWRHEVKYNEGRGYKKSHGEGIAAVIVCSVIFCIVHAMSLSVSYGTYLDDRSFFSATSEQYFSAITVYKDHAVIDMGKAAFTDLKYQGYQENVGKFVVSLRNRIIRYNKSIIEKRTMGKNPFFNWFVVEPDADMVVMKMKAE